MENTYYSAFIADRQKNTAIVMAILAILLAVGISIYIGITIYSETLLKILVAPFKSGPIDPSDPASGLSTFLYSLVFLLIVLCFVFPATTLILGIIVLASKGRKRTVSIVMYVFMGITLFFFIRMLFL